MSVLDITLERETANDETATVVAVFIRSGTLVEKDEVLFDIENSKATQEVVAPVAGLLTHSLKVGGVVEFGVPIAQITPDQITPAETTASETTSVQIGPNAGPEIASAGPDAPMARPTAEVISLTSGLPQTAHAAAHPVSSAASASISVPASRPRFSQAAAALIADLGLAPSSFSAGFVTARDVRAAGLGAPTAGAEPRRLDSLLDRHPSAQPAPASRASQPPPALGDASGVALGGRKRTEIEVLSQGAGATMLSVLGIRLGAMSVVRADDHFLAGQITDLVIYEASRLLKKYPRLNAAYADGRVHLHRAVHAGLAIDSGGQLLVYGIENADRIGLPNLGETIADAVARYADGALTAAELTRATFTVTDLSADELDFVLPLLPRGQSCILGITRDATVGYRIFAGFDHRVTEGREVASFLSELRVRLQSFAAPMPAAATVAAHCAFCDQSAADAVGRGKTKGLLKMVDLHSRDILCCASCWNGW
jgi:pyruvate/2-oxoglutarate dehydrogenase complex dihydrolipoamide acyltransferase (E2) component